MLFLQHFQVIFERELFSICDGLPSASKIDQLLSYGVDLDILDDVCSLIIFTVSIIEL